MELATSRRSILGHINGQTGDTSVPGLVDEIGAFDGPTELGKDEFLLYTLTFSADALGDADFASHPADNLPFGFVLVYGEENEVQPALIDYGSATLSIVPEPGTAALLCLGAGGVALGRGRRRRWGDSAEKSYLF